MATDLKSTLEQIAEDYGTAKTDAKRRLALWWQLSEVIAAIGDQVGYDTLRPLLDLKDALDDVDRGHAPPLLTRSKNGGRPKRSVADEELLLRAASATTARAREKRVTPDKAATWVINDLKKRRIKLPLMSRKPDAIALEDWRQKLFKKTARPYQRNTHDVLSCGDSTAILDGLALRWNALKPPAN